MSGSMLSDVELTLLSLLAEGPRYGREIEHLIELRGLREWLIVGRESFYYILQRLEQQELLTRTQRADSPEPEHTIYQITDAGRGVVQTAVSDLLCQSRSLGESFAIGLANLGALKPQQVYRSLIQHHESLTHRLHVAETVWARHQKEARASESTRALYTHGIAVMQAELDWLTTFIEQWRKDHPVVDRDEAREDNDRTQTPLHHRTIDADAGKKIQKLKRPRAE